MALDNKSLVSSANYLTDLNSTYSKAIVLYKNNVLIPNGINHTIEAKVSYFDKVELIDKELLLKAPVVIDSNTSMLAELANIVSEISAHIDDSIILNSSAINGTDLLIDISVSTDSTILRTLNIKVKYGSILKYDLDSISNEYIQILTNAGTINNEIFAAIIDVSNQVIPNIEEILLFDDKASEVSSNTLLVSSIKDDIIAMRDETIVNRDSSLQSSINSENSATSSEESNQSSMNARDTILAIELQSETFAENALNSSIASAASADIATDKANISIAQAIIATNKASEALTSANNASDSEDNALSYKNNAEQFANDSSDSATISEEQAIISSAKASEALASALDASTYASSASASAGYANTKASEANASAASASTNENKAEKWAEELEDVAVEPGKYSAMHWAAKAQAFSKGSAITINYNNNLSGLTATNIQAAIDEIATSYLESFEFIATENQTTFNVVNTGVIEVFINGIKLSNTDYVFNTSSMSLNVGAVAGMIVTVVVYSSFRVADTYTKAELGIIIGDVGNALDTINGEVI